MHGIYVPGLGDHRSLGQDDAVKGWAKHGIEMQYFALGWGDGEPFKPKLNKLISKIDELYAKDKMPIVLIGASAGASAIINSYCERKDKVSALVYICGKIQNPQSIGDDYYLKNPAFKDSMTQLGQNLEKLTADDKNKMLSVVPIYDNLVPVADTRISGVKEIRMNIIGHSLAIAYSITLGKQKIIREIKSVIKSSEK